MGNVYANCVEDTTTTTGTGGSFVLDGSAPAGAQTFIAALDDGDAVTYEIDDLDDSGTDVEVGTATWAESTTILGRNAVLYSTNGGSAVNWGAGTKKVRLVFAAERFCDSAYGIGIGNLTDNYIPYYDGNAGNSELVDSTIDTGGANGITVDSGNLIVAENAVFGEDRNPKTIASWTSGTSHAYVGVYEATNAAYLHIQGASGGANISLVDLGGGSNDKWMNLSMDAGKLTLDSLTDAGGAGESDIQTWDHGTGNVVFGSAGASTARVYVSGGRLQIDNDKTFTMLNAASGTGGTIYCDTSDDVHFTVDGTTAFTLDETNDEVELKVGLQHGSNAASISSNAVTLDMGASNTYALDLAAATGDVTITLGEPNGDLIGFIDIKQDSGMMSRGITWASSGSATFHWVDENMTGEPSWSFDTPLSHRMIRIHYIKSLDRFVMHALLEYT